MIFQHTWKQVLDGTKTQTRRLVKPGEGFNAFPSGWIKDVRVYPDLPLPHSMIGKIKWAVGRDYAVQPGRGKKAVGRIRITGIRQERVQDISIQDAIAEGVPEQTATYTHPVYRSLSVAAYAKLWNAIHTKPGETWNDNPLVWVISFCLVKDDE